MLRSNTIRTVCYNDLSGARQNGAAENIRWKCDAREMDVPYFGDYHRIDDWFQVMSVEYFSIRSLLLLHTRVCFVIVIAGTQTIYKSKAIFVNKNLCIS